MGAANFFRPRPGVAVIDLTYGDVTREYLALREAAGLVKGVHSAIRIDGSETRRFLNGLVTQDVDGPPGAVKPTAMLSPKGKVRALGWIAVGATSAVFIVETAIADRVVGDLRRYRVRIDATVGDPEPLAEVWGPRSQDVIQAWKMTFWDATEPERFAVRVPLGGLDRYFVSDVPVPTTVTLRQAGELAVTAVRVEAGEPLVVRDLDERTLLQETGLEQQVASFSKGCYLGQEIVTRIEYRGHVNRRLRGLGIGTNVLPPEGAHLMRTGQTVGTVTSVAESLTFRSPIGLGLVSAKLEVGDDVEVVWEEGTAPALVRELPFDDFTLR